MGRAGVVQVDVEPGLQGVGSKIDAFARTLKPFGLRAELLSNIGDDLGDETRKGQRSLDSINTDRADRELRDLGDTGERELMRLGGNVRATNTQLVALGGGATIVGSRILKGLRPAVDAAADLQETVGAAGAVFGDQLPEVERFAEGAADALGLSKQQTLEAANMFGTYADMAGKGRQEAVAFAQALTQVAADAGARWGLDTSEGVQAIGSAFRGEYDSLERFGLFLKEAEVQNEALRLGLIKTKGEALDRAARVQAAYNLIVQQGSRYAGEFARETDGAAGQMKIFNATQANAKADAGSGLLGVMTEIEKVGTGALTVLDALPGGVEAAGVAIAGLGVTSILGGAVTGSLGAIRELRSLRDKPLQPLGNQDVSPFGSTVASAASATGATEGVARAMDDVSVSSARAGSAGAAAMNNVATSAAAASAVVGSSLEPFESKLEPIGSKLDALTARSGVIDVESWELGGGAIERFGGSLEPIPQKVQAIGSTVAPIGSTATKSFGMMGTAITAVGGVLTAVAIGEAIGGISNQLRDLDSVSRRAMEEFAANVNQGELDVLTAFEGIAEAFDARAGVPDWIRSVGEEFSLAGVLDTRDIEYWQMAFDSISASRPAEEVRMFISALEAQNERLDHSSKEYKETKKLLDEWKEANGTSAKAQRNQSQATTEQTAALDRFGNAIDETKGKLSQQAQSFAQAFEIPNEAIGAFFDLVDAKQEEADATAEVNRLRGGSSESMEEEAENARDLAAAVRDVEGAKRDLAAADRDAADATRDRQALEAELAHVDPNLDPNRYRELAEKVRDAQDDEADARDRVRDAADSVRDAEDQAADAKGRNAAASDDLAQAEDRQREATQRAIDATTAWDVAFAAFAEEVERNPALLDDLNAKIDEWVARGLISEDVARRWKEQIAGLASEVERLRLEIALATKPGEHSNIAGGGIVPGVGRQAAERGRETQRRTLNEAQGRTIGLNAPFAGRGGDLVDENGHRWNWDNERRRWLYHDGGYVDPERADARGEVDARLQAGEFVVSRPAVQRIGSNVLAAANDGAPLELPPAPPSNAQIVAELQAQSATLVAIVTELQGQSSVIANMQNVTYAPTIHAQPQQVDQTMAEGFRASRRDAWNVHGRDLAGRP